MTQQGMVKEKIISKNGIVWVLGIAVSVLIVGIFYQHFKNVQTNQTNIAQEKISENKESITKDQETIKQLQGELKELKAKQSTGAKSFAKKAVANPDSKEISNQDVKSASSTDPTATKIYSANQIKFLTNTFYSPLFKRLGLSKKDEDDLRNLLIARNTAYDNQANEIRAERWTEGNMNIEESSKKLADIKQEQDKIIRNFLGEEKYQRYIQYNNSKGVFDIADKDSIELLENSLSGTEDQINEHQRDNLEASMAEVFKNFMSNYAPELQGSPPYKMEFVSEATTTKMAEHMDDLQNNYFYGAKSILSENQMKNYESIIGGKIEKSKSALNKRTQEMKEYSDRY
jgi:hypothetical protein